MSIYDINYNVDYKIDILNFKDVDTIQCQFYEENLYNVDSMFDFFWIKC